MVRNSPEDALPDRVSSGKYSYTKVHRNGAALQVLLRERAFFFKKWKGAIPVDKQATRCWSNYDSVPAAWEAVKAEIGWD